MAPAVLFSDLVVVVPVVQVVLRAVEVVPGAALRPA